MLARLRTHLTYANVVSTLGVFAVAGSALFAASAMAEAAVYEGHVKGIPGTQFDLTITKRNGKRFVDRLEYDEVPVTCENGPDAHNGFNNYSSGNRVRGGAFDIRQPNPDFFTHLVGELKRGGRAAGTYKQRVNFGAPEGVCRTGELEWVAEKP
jgi:hypothetical protein